MNYTLALKLQEVTTPHLKKKGLDIIPIYRNDSTLNFSEKYMAQIYRRIVREETVHKIFYDGSVTNTNDFIEFIKNKENEIYFVEYDGDEVGFFWLNKFRQKSAFITYCFYKSFKGEKALKISKLCIEFLFDRTDSHGEYVLDVLLGLTPSNNKLALKFLHKNGMTILGKIPGFLYDYFIDKKIDGIFSYIQRNSEPVVTMPSLLFLH